MASNMRSYSKCRNQSTFTTFKSYKRPNRMKDKPQTNLSDESLEVDPDDTFDKLVKGDVFQPVQYKPMFLESPGTSGSKKSSESVTMLNDQPRKKRKTYKKKEPKRKIETKKARKCNTETKKAEPERKKTYFDETIDFELSVEPVKPRRNSNEELMMELIKDCTDKHRKKLESLPKLITSTPQVEELPFFVKRKMQISFLSPIANSEKRNDEDTPKRNKIGMLSTTRRALSEIPCNEITENNVNCKSISRNDTQGTLYSQSQCKKQSIIEISDDERIKMSVNNCRKQLSSIFRNESVQKSSDEESKVEENIFMQKLNNRYTKGDMEATSTPYIGNGVVYNNKNSGIFKEVIDKHVKGFQNYDSGDLFASYDSQFEKCSRVLSEPLENCVTARQSTPKSKFAQYSSKNICAIQENVASMLASNCSTLDDNSIHSIYTTKMEEKQCTNTKIETFNNISELTNTECIQEDSMVVSTHGEHQFSNKITGYNTSNDTSTESRIEDSSFELDSSCSEYSNNSSLHESNDSIVESEINSIQKSLSTISLEESDAKPRTLESSSNLSYLNYVLAVEVTRHNFDHLLKENSEKSCNNTDEINRSDSRNMSVSFDNSDEHKISIQNASSISMNSLLALMNRRQAIVNITLNKFAESVNTTNCTNHDSIAAKLQSYSNKLEIEKSCNKARINFKRKKPVYNSSFSDDSLSNSLVHHHKRLNANKLNKIAVVNLTLNNFEDIAFKDRDLSITMESVHNRTDDSYSNRIMVNFNARKPSKDLPILESDDESISFDTSIESRKVPAVNITLPSLKESIHEADSEKLEIANTCNRARINFKRRKPATTLNTLEESVLEESDNKDTKVACKKKLEFNNAFNNICKYKNYDMNTSEKLNTWNSTSDSVIFITPCQQENFTYHKNMRTQKSTKIIIPDDTCNESTICSCAKRKPDDSTVHHSIQSIQSAKSHRRQSSKIVLHSLDSTLKKNCMSALETFATSKLKIGNAHSPLPDRSFYDITVRLSAINFDASKFSELTAKDILWKRCGQTKLIPFSSVFNNLVLKNAKKIGEGVYGEVFLLQKSSDETSVIKIIPIEGVTTVNGERQKRYDEILSEVVVAQELSNLRNCEKYKTSGFSELKRTVCVQGTYPQKLIELWNDFDLEHGSENESPTIFDGEQAYIILEFAFAGKDLESFVFNNAQQGCSVFRQTICALAVAEANLQFEHRDLHWGNILVKAVDKNKIISYHFDGNLIEIPSHGVEVTIIDFTMSRVTCDGVCIFNDLAEDPELFTGEGDYQFEIYRMMQEHTGNVWDKFSPYTNILWMHYILDKLISAIRYKYISTKIHKQYIHMLKRHFRSLLGYSSVEQYVREQYRGAPSQD